MVRCKGSIAKKAIVNYGKAVGDPKGMLELMVYFVESNIGWGFHDTLSEIFLWGLSRGVVLAGLA